MASISTQWKIPNWCLLYCVSGSIVLTMSSLVMGAALAVEPIVLGQSLALQSADIDGRGEQVQAGAQALVDSVNARGGISGRPLKLVTLNHEGDMSLHRQNLRKLVSQHKAMVWINCVGDIACAVASAETQVLDIPLVGVQSGLSTLVRAREPRVFRIRPGYVREAESVVRQIKSLGITSVALVSDPPGSPEVDEPLQGFQAALARAAILSTVLTLNVAESSLPDLLAQLNRGRYGAAVLLLRGASVGRLIDRQADQSNEWPLTVFIPSNGTLNIVWGSFPQRLIGYTMVVPNPDRSSVILARELQQSADMAGVPAATSAAGMEAYISAKLVVEALRRSGPRLDAQTLFTTLDTMGEIDLGGLHLNLARNRASASEFIDLAVRPKLNAR